MTKYKHVQADFGDELNHQFLVAKIDGILRLAHNKKRLVSYLDIAMATAEFSGSASLGRALGTIMENYVNHSELQLLTAIVAKSIGGTPIMPGYGFFGMAEKLGYGNTGTATLSNRPEVEQKQFWLDALKNLGYDVTALKFI